MTGADKKPDYQIEWIAPDRDLTDLVNTFYIVRMGAGVMTDMMPAYSAQLLMFVEGHAVMHFPGSEPRRSEPIGFNAPLLQAIPFEVHGPLLQVGASLTPLGWVMLSGRPADEVNNCSVGPDRVLSDDHIRKLRVQIETCRTQQVEPQSLCAVIGDILRAAQAKPRPTHEQLVATINRWLAGSLNPKLEELYSQTSFSTRQVQRLCKHYFGVPPVQLLARYRAVRAAMLLSNENLSEDMRDEVLGAYYDQAHLIRDVRRYTGRTPKGFSEKSISQDTLNPVAHGRNANALLSNPRSRYRKQSR